MIKHNYHTHTKYCKHATMTPEELVLFAIDKGLETIGISEHGPIPSNQSSYRINSTTEAKFLEEVAFLKEKYKDKIKVLCAYEIELIDTKSGEDLLEWSTSLVDRPEIDYIILGHHTYHDLEHVYVSRPTDELIDRWLEVLDKALATKKFLYMAHPDGFFNPFNNEWNEKTEKLTRGICEIAKKYDTVLGINVNGLCDDDKAYPSKHFWKVVGEYGVRGVIELDAHNEIPFEEKYIEQARAMAEEFNVELVEEFFNV